MSDRTLDLELLSTTKGFDGQTARVPSLSSEVEFSEDQRPDTNSLEFAFEPKSGTLIAVTSYGVFSASGFLTKDSLGTGPSGRKGKRGLDGATGAAGFEGREGKTGCPGIPGKPGVVGIAGLDAEDGPRGPVGVCGCYGDEGPTGVMGPMGPTGPDGPAGAPGSSCLVGPDGDVGPKPIEVVVVSDIEPTDTLVHLWAQPVNVDTGDPTNPEVIEPLKGSIADQNITLSPVSGDFYEGTAAFVLAGFSGGKGPFTYNWTGDWSTMSPEIIVSQTGTSSTNFNLNARIYIARGASVTKSGKTRLTITDTGDNNKTLAVEANFSFSGRNSSTGTPDPGGGGGGGGGCIVFGEPVYVSASKTIPIEEALDGSTLVGLRIDGLPDSTFNADAFLPWASSSLNAQTTPVTVVNAAHSTHTNHYLINGELRLTSEEHLLANRKGYWTFIRIKDLRVGDSLYHISGQSKPVESIERIEGLVRVVSLNVETADTFFVRGYLLHNIDDGGPIHKN